MSFTFKPAVRQKIGLLFAIAGASGSGKTFSALTLAKGLANGTGRVAVIDTEAGRALHYADRFEFLHGDMEPPFTPERYVEAIHAAQDAGATVIVIDSMSHEWNGEGGCADIQAEIALKMAKGNPERVDAMTAPAWAKPKIRHKRMVNRLLQSRAHLIFCLRAEEKIRIDEVQDGNYKKKVITPIGFQPICEKGFMFEMSGSVTMHPESPGVVRYDLTHKLSEELQAILPHGQHITEQTGAGIRQWTEKGTGERRVMDKATEAATALIERIQDTETSDTLGSILAEQMVITQRDWLRQKRPELSTKVEAAISDKEQSFGPPDDDFPGEPA
jgi:AAA domain